MYRVSEGRFTMTAPWIGAGAEAEAEARAEDTVENVKYLIFR